MSDHQQGLGVRVTKMLMEAEPGLLVVDPGAIGRVTGMLAAVMGSALAGVVMKGGEHTYQRIKDSLVEKIDESARATVKAAQREAADPTVNTNH